MSSLAKKIQQDQQQQQQQREERKVKTVVVPKPIFTAGEKFLYIGFAIFVAIFAVKIISAQTQIYAMNREVIVLQEKIEEQTKSNKDLSDQVSELSTYDRIWKKASDLGLTLKDSNVKVVQD